MKALIKGKQKPHGNIKISGAKNAATKLLAAALISDTPVTLNNFPTELVDVQYKASFIEDLGGEILMNSDKESIYIDSSNVENKTLNDYSYFFRTTYLLVPGLIKKSKSAKIPYPGGCKIGDRGYDLHIMIWEKLGATVVEKPDYIEVIAEKGFISGQTIDFPISTIGGTENALICASIIDGITFIRNAYISPEVQNLIDFLKSMGAEIDVVGNSYVKVKGKKSLEVSSFEVIPDRIEALTWIIYGVLSKGSFTIENVPFETMEIPLIHLKNAGIDLYRNSKNIYISPSCLENGVIQPFEIATGTHPGIISDMQPFYVLLALHANGISRIYDYRYPERVKYCHELSKIYNGMLETEYGKIKVLGNQYITPKSSIVDSTDLRGSMAVVMAALLAEGESVVNDIEMALRGYNKLEDKLEKLGVIIKIQK